MIAIRNMFTAIAAAPLLGACISASGGPILIPDGSSSRPAPSGQTAQTQSSSPTTANPQILRAAGLEGVIGAGATQLTRQFGAPQLDVREGDARKLQFAGEACVLDIFLYPERTGATPTATHVEARRASDGRNVDRAACVRALRWR